eukprot:m.521222 g.521222  ORF g.521222 m.521222 type:complete len:58 (+) comp21960_c0_seq6:949-1122(+)
MWAHRTIAPVFIRCAATLWYVQGGGDYSDDDVARNPEEETFTTGMPLMSPTSPIRHF